MFKDILLAFKICQTEDLDIFNTFFRLIIKSCNDRVTNLLWSLFMSILRRHVYLYRATTTTYLPSIFLQEHQILLVP